MLGFLAGRSFSLSCLECRVFTWKWCNVLRQCVIFVHVDSSFCHWAQSFVYAVEYVLCLFGDFKHICCEREKKKKQYHKIIQICERRWAQNWRGPFLLSNISWVHSAHNVITLRPISLRRVHMHKTPQNAIFLHLWPFSHEGGFQMLVNYLLFC